MGCNVELTDSFGSGMSAFSVGTEPIDEDDISSSSSDQIDLPQLSEECGRHRDVLTTIKTQICNANHK